MSGVKFRLKAFGLHITGSATALALVLGLLWLGWYRWPGWYLTGVLSVAAMMAGIDVVLGPLLTFVVANPAKPRRGLARDIAVIVAVQVVALIYGTTTLWQGRPLYYLFSENELQVTQASDLEPGQISLGRKLNPEFAPHWYSRPRWVWAPLPQDPKIRDEIMKSAITGGNDVIQMPRYFKPWAQGLPALRKQLKAANQLHEFSLAQKQTLQRRMLQMGFNPQEANAVPMLGRARPLLGVFDLQTMQISALIRAD
jgi:hypothetical protein